jgi:hypothetical protein
MGNAAFGEGAALEALTAFAEPEEDASGRALALRVDRSFRLGEPVVVELKLATRRAEGITVHRHLHPSDGFVSIAIERPGGTTVVHAPLIEHCVRPETVVLDAERPAIYESAYIGSGDEGRSTASPSGAARCARTGRSASPNGWRSRCRRAAAQSASPCRRGPPRSSWRSSPARYRCSASR